MKPDFPILIWRVSMYIGESDRTEAYIVRAIDGRVALLKVLEAGKFALAPRIKASYFVEPLGEPLEGE